MRAYARPSAPTGRLAPSELLGMELGEIQEHVANYAQEHGFDSYVEGMVRLMVEDFGVPRSLITGALRADLRCLR